MVETDDIPEGTVGGREVCDAIGIVLLLCHFPQAVLGSSQRKAVYRYRKSVVGQGTVGPVDLFLEAVRETSCQDGISTGERLRNGSIEFLASLDAVCDRLYPGFGSKTRFSDAVDGVPLSLLDGRRGGLYAVAVGFLLDF